MIYGISHASQKYSSKISYLFLLLFVILHYYGGVTHPTSGNDSRIDAWGLKIDTHSMGSLPVSSGNEKLISYAGMSQAFLLFYGFLFYDQSKI